MQLKIQRSQRAGGLVGNTVFFCLDVRADYSPEERSNIGRYKLGGQAIYNSKAAQKHLDNAGAQLNRTQTGGTGERFAGLARGALSMAMAKMSLNISIASLGRGHHIECKDLEELLEAEDTVRSACKNVTRYLEIAATFNGSETVVEYEKGEEKVHVTQTAPPLLSYASPDPTSPKTDDPYAEYRPDESGASPQQTLIQDAAEQMGQDFARLGHMLKQRWLVLEGKILAFTASKDWTVDEVQVRMACGGAAALLLVLLYEIT